MILVRDVFQLKFGKAKEAVTLWKEGKTILQAKGHAPQRVLTDLVGTFYTFVFEGEYENLAAFEKDIQESMKQPDWQAWYQKFMPLVESGHREIFNIV